MKKIGLLGGTFDPPHIGHFIIAQEVKNEFQLDEVWFIPTNEPPHKQQAYFDSKQRFDMLTKVTNQHSDYFVDPIELNRHGKSYTIDTMKELQKRHPTNQFYFIIGADMVEYLPKWHQIEKLMELVQFIGVGRKQYSLETTYPIHMLHTPTIEISSTDIKKRIEMGWDVKYFLPHEVYIYLKENVINGFE